MIRTILVPATGSKADDATFASALSIARHLSAHLVMLHVRQDPVEVIAAMGDMGAGLAAASLIESLEKSAAAREAQAKKGFEAFCRRETVGINAAVAPTATAVSAAFRTEIGNGAYWLAEYGRTADLVVVGRTVEADGETDDLLEAALLDSGRPLYIPGPAPVAPDTVAIAWKSTREAALAVCAADPFLALAKRVVVLTATEGEPSDDGSVARLIDTLRRHGPEVQSRTLPADSRSAANRLLAAAVEAGAGLLVMGGYGHSRLREWMFGGVTEAVLAAAPLPVLMAH